MPSAPPSDQSPAQAPVVTKTGGTGASGFLRGLPFESAAQGLGGAPTNPVAAYTVDLVQSLHAISEAVLPANVVVANVPGPSQADVEQFSSSSGSMPDGFRLSVAEVSVMSGASGRVVSAALGTAAADDATLPAEGSELKEVVVVSERVVATLGLMWSAVQLGVLGGTLVGARAHLRVWDPLPVLTGAGESRMPDTKNRDRRHNPPWSPLLVPMNEVAARQLEVSMDGTQQVVR